MLERVKNKAVNIDRSALRLTDTIYRYVEEELSETLRAIAYEIGLSHIAYLRYSVDGSCEASLTTAVATYSRAWQTQYYLKGCAKTDPVVARGRSALMPFDWDTLGRCDPAVAAFFAQAQLHDIGLNGLSIPVRNQIGACSLVSYTSDHSKTEWARYKRAHMAGLQRLASLIDSAADASSEIPMPAAALSRREQECLIWAAKGKAAEEICDLTNVGFLRVKAHLDTARHKLHCMNLTHAIAVAIATGAVPATALR